MEAAKSEVTQDIHPAPEPSPASQYVGLYVALVNFLRQQPPAALSQAVSQAVTTMAPLAVNLLLQDKLASQAKG